MPEQFPYPETDWAAGRMRTRGEPLEDSPVRMAGMLDSLGRIFGFGKREAEAKPTDGPGKTYIAKPMGEYPTDADAEFAKSHGFGYGTVSEPYINQQTAKVYGQVRTATAPKGKKGETYFHADSAQGKYLSEIMDAINDNAKSVNIDLTKPEFKSVRDRLGNTYAKAAIAVEGNSLAKLGFDPKLIMMNVAGEQTQTSGAYERLFKGRSLGESGAEGIYANAMDPSVLVHESMHRGIEMLRQKYPEQARKLLNNLPQEEMIVRYMMIKHAGDPEKIGPLSGKPDPQRDAALKIFEDKYWSKKYQDALDGLMKLGAEEVAKKRPRGPR